MAVEGKVYLFGTVCLEAQHETCPVLVYTVAAERLAFGVDAMIAETTASNATDRDRV
jgi:hypothetical protein